MSNQINLKTIRIMLAIQKEGSFAKAAKALYISQPALTQHIKRIESELSFSLYHRVNGRCIPTEAAEILLKEGASLLDQYNDMMAHLFQLSHEKGREIRFGWPTGYTVQYLNSTVSRDSQLSALNLQVVEDTVEQLLAQLLQRNLHFALVPALYYHPDLVYTTIRQEEFYLAVPKMHAANDLLEQTASDGYVDLALLHDMPFISLTANPYVQFINPLFEDAGYSPDIIFKCKNWNSSHSLVEDNLGLSIVPYWFAETGHANINYYRIRSKARNFRIFACVYHKNQTLSQEFQSFIEIIKDTYGDEHADTPFDMSILKHRL